MTPSAKMRFARHRLTIDFYQVASVEVVNIGARAIAAFDTTGLSAAEFIEICALVTIVGVLTRQSTRAFAARSIAQTSTRVVLVTLMVCRIIGMEVIRICTDLDTVEHTAAAAAAKTMRIVAGVFVNFLPVQPTLCRTALGTAEFQARVIVAAKVDAIFLQMVVMIWVIASRFAPRNRAFFVAPFT
jgi:hypothetical protein